MFATAKRAREDDDDEEEQRSPSDKKPRILPFRSSPTTKHTSLFSKRHVQRPQALTPADSSDDDFDHYLPFSNVSRPSAIPSFLHTQDEDMDMDMGDSQPLESPLWSPKTPATSSMMTSASLASPAYSSLLTVGHSPVHQTARLPTPIYGHFSTLHNPMQTTGASPTATHPSVAGVARSSLAEQHDAYLRRRCLPSPISEGDNMNSPTAITSGMMKELDVNATGTAALPPSSVALPENDMMTPESPEFGVRKDSTGSYGSRRRSDAISGNSEGSKIVFSMGYRADCDKCREKVPGHYSHILRI